MIVFGTIMNWPFRVRLSKIHVQQKRWRTRKNSGHFLVVLQALLKMKPAPRTPANYQHFCLSWRKAQMLSIILEHFSIHEYRQWTLFCGSNDTLPYKVNWLSAHWRFFICKNYVPAMPCLPVKKCPFSIGQCYVIEAELSDTNYYIIYVDAINTGK